MNGIRDPVHGWIEYNIQEKGVIDSCLVQRLRWVSQLTGANEVFPGGCNNRFIHSLGVFHLCGKYFDSLLLSSIPQNIPDLLTNRVYYRSLIRLAGLLHDVGHGPFSHAFDQAIYSEIYGIPDGGHDCHREKIVASDLIAPFIRQCGVDPDDLIALWNRKSSQYSGRSQQERELLDVLRPLIQGPLGADRMDFTLRDSYFMGTTHFGTIACDRIISNVLISLKDGVPKLCYRIKCLTDIIAALESRFYMYENVYLHRTVCAAGILINEMMTFAAKDLALTQRTHDISRFSRLNDATLIGEIETTPRDTPDLCQARMYLGRLFDRKLPKMIREYRIEADEEMPDIHLENNHKLYQSRPINGIDPSLFDRHEIYFVSGKREDDNQLHTCAEVLTTLRYIPARKPFRFLRVYEM